MRKRQRGTPVVENTEPSSAPAGGGALRAACGLPLLVCVFTVYFAQGFRSLGSLGLSYFLKDVLRLSAAESALLTSTALIPWSLKPLYGITSDCVPIHGRRRKPYILLAAMLGTASWATLAIQVDEGRAGGGLAIVSRRRLLLCMTLGNLSTALSDVVVDAMVAEKSRDLGGGGGGGSEHSEDALDAMLQNGCWTAMAAGGLAASALGYGLGVGSAGSTLSLRTVCLVTAACPLLVGLSALGVDEARVASAGSGGAVAQVQATLRQLWYALRSPCVYRPMAYVFLSGALAPSLDAPLFYYATERLDVTADFSAASMALLWGSMMVGSVLFQRFFSAPGRHRVMFFWSQAGLAACNLLTLAQVLGVFDALLPTVPPRYVMVSTDVLAAMAGRFGLMPFLVMAAQLCPPGVEGTLFAAFMSLANFSSEVSRLFGAQLAAALRIGTRLEGAAGEPPAAAAAAAAAVAVPKELDFTMLPQALVLRTVLMLVPLLFLNTLVPLTFVAPTMPAGGSSARHAMDLGAAAGKSEGGEKSELSGKKKQLKID